MREKTFLLVMSCFMLTLVVGCSGGGSTAMEVAGSYKMLNKSNTKPWLAEAIRSGKADEMVRDGQAERRTRINGLGSGRVLVTEYLIHGEVYRVEVRRPFNPMINIPYSRIRYGECVSGKDKKIINWFRLSSVYGAIKNNSYQATPEVAFRSWRGVDGTVHAVKIVPGLKPTVGPSEDPVNLYIRTKDWPDVDVWFSGQGSQGRPWFIMTPAAAGFEDKEQIPFINLKLNGAIGKI